jgi:hypothetical protein
MVTHGKGGWTFETIYNLPVFLRNYYMKELVDAWKAEAEAIKSTR